MNNINYEFSLNLNKLIDELKKYKNYKVVFYGYSFFCKLAALEFRDNIVCIVDKNAESFKDIGIDFIYPENLYLYNFDYLIITALGREKEISASLNIDKNKIIELQSLNNKPFSFKTTIEDKNKWNLLKDKYKGERCFIIGNGPSLNKHDLTILKNEYSFGVNGIFYKTIESGFKPTFYTIEDNHVIDDNIETINAYNCEYKFFPTRDRNKILENSNTLFFEYDMGFFNKNNENFCKPRFSFDCADKIFAGQTVTYTNIQLAYYMGFEEVYLIGIDFNYEIPINTIIEGDTYISNDDDPNHFHPDYFGKGKKWHDPKLDRVLLNFTLAKKVFELNNKKIYNATIGGKLEIFERINWFSIENLHK